MAGRRVGDWVVRSFSVDSKPRFSGNLRFELALNAAELARGPAPRGPGRRARTAVSDRSGTPLKREFSASRGDPDAAVAACNGPSLLPVVSR